MLQKLFLSVLEQDKEPVVLCDTESVIAYMNSAAISRYHGDLTGTGLDKCHNAESNRKIEKVLAWFKESKEHNEVFTYHSEEENKDVYMIALRDEEGALIGYYEKHMPRNAETRERYEMRKGLKAE